MKVTVDIIITYKDWKSCKFINKNLVKKVVRDIMKRFENFRKVEEFELAILLTDNAGMLGLNQKFRGLSKSTNVLSFPDVALDTHSLLELTKDLHYMYLGDIAFGYEIIHNEALSQNKTFENHFIHLLVHSILHLIGFDHHNDEEADKMESLETEILQTFAIDSPYIAKT